MMKAIKIILIFMLLGVSIYCFLNFYNIEGEKLEEQKVQEEFIDIAEIPEEPEKESKINFDELIAINPDIKAWIYIEGTNINYPIVQGNNNTYYLKHNYKKEYSGYGSIYMDSTARDDFTSLNTFIYGHYTSNKSMFGELGNFMNQDFFDTHKNIFIYTPDKNYKLEIFSVHVDNAFSDSYQMSFVTEDDYKSYLDLMIEKSVIRSNVKVDYTKDKIVTLYSCSRETNYKKQDRYYIHAKIAEM